LPPDLLPSLRAKMVSPGPADADWLPVRIAAAAPVAEDVCAYALVGLDGAALPAWEAGAHIDVEIETGIVRQYSLCGDPADRGRYRIAVKREAGGRGGSLRLQQLLLPGSRVRIGRPRNNFALQPAADEQSLLIAGGIGITPLLAMAHTLHRRGAAF